MRALTQIVSNILDLMIPIYSARIFERDRAIDLMDNSVGDPEGNVLGVFVARLWLARRNAF